MNRGDVAAHDTRLDPPRILPTDAHRDHRPDRAARLAFDERAGVGQIDQIDRAAWCELDVVAAVDLRGGDAGAALAALVAARVGGAQFHGASPAA
jgi:hypothetical protein